MHCPHAGRFGMTPECGVLRCLKSSVICLCLLERAHLSCFSGLCTRHMDFVIHKINDCSTADMTTKMFFPKSVKLKFLSKS